MFHQMQLSTYYIALIFSGILMLSTFSGFIYKIFKTLFNELLTIMLIAIIILFIQILSISTNCFLLFYISIFFYGIFRGSYVPLFKTYVAHNTNSNNYNSFLSLMNVGGALCTALLFLGFGKIIDMYNIITGLCIYFCIFISLFLFTIVLNINLLKQD